MTVRNVILVTGNYGKYPNMGILALEIIKHGLGGRPLILGVTIVMGVGTIVKVIEIIKIFFTNQHTFKTF